jgi:hypothetical protein
MTEDAMAGQEGASRLRVADLEVAEQFVALGLAHPARGRRQAK